MEDGSGAVRWAVVWQGPSPTSGGDADPVWDRVAAAGSLVALPPAAPGASPAFVVVAPGLVVVVAEEPGTGAYAVAATLITEGETVFVCVW